jgi:glutathione S-transferase
MKAFRLHTLSRRAFASKSSFKPGIDRTKRFPFKKDIELYHNGLSSCSMQVRIVLNELGVDYEGHHVNLITTGEYGNLKPEYTTIHPGKLVPVMLHEGYPIYESNEIIKYLANHYNGNWLFGAESSAGGGTSAVADDDGVSRQSFDLENARKESIDRILGLVKPVKFCLSGSNLDESLNAGFYSFLVPYLFTCLPQVESGKLWAGLVQHPKLQSSFFLLLLHYLSRAGCAGRWAFLASPKFKGLRRRARIAVRDHLCTLERELKTHGGPYAAGANFSIADVYLMTSLNGFQKTGHGDLIENNETVQKYFDLLRARPSFQKEVDVWYQTSPTKENFELFDKWMSNEKFRDMIRC